jgi:hypothetical protein
MYFNNFNPRKGTHTATLAEMKTRGNILVRGLLTHPEIVTWSNMPQYIS